MVLRPTPSVGRVAFEPAGHCLRPANTPHCTHDVTTGDSPRAWRVVASGVLSGWPSWPAGAPNRPTAAAPRRLRPAPRPPPMVTRTRWRPPRRLALVRPADPVRHQQAAGHHRAVDPSDSGPQFHGAGLGRRVAAQRVVGAGPARRAASGSPGYDFNPLFAALKPAISGRRPGDLPHGDTPLAHRRARSPAFRSSRCRPGRAEPWPTSATTRARPRPTTRSTRARAASTARWTRWTRPASSTLARPGTRPRPRG